MLETFFNLKTMWFQVWNLAKFQTWNRIFSTFSKKISNVPKYRKFICPEIPVCEVSEVFIFQKNDHRSSGNLNQNFRFSNFKSEFFLIFQKKRQKTRKFRTFIYREPHVSQFWAKSEKLFSGRAGGRSLITTAVAAVVRRGAS